MLKELGAHIQTDYALVVQWDGFVIDGSAWADEFWNYDYIGARWPHAGFIASATAVFVALEKLLNALRDEAITPGADDKGNEDNEDEAICIRHRELLERKYGIAFPDERVADRFAFEASRSIGPTLGFHGVFNFWQVLSDEELITFSRTAPEAIAEGLGFGALCRNPVDLKRIEVARELVTRRPRRFRAMCSARPACAAGSHCALLPSLSPPLQPQPSRRPHRATTPPCGSGRRYKGMSRQIGATSAGPPAVVNRVDAGRRAASARAGQRPGCR